VRRPATRNKDFGFSKTLHLLQNSMVYIDTLMMQTHPEQARMAEPNDPDGFADLRAITPLVWEHINPYGRYDLDMESRIAI
jgi:hypothetical protein